jgi:hypothetical protein
MKPRLINITQRAGVPEFCKDITQLPERNFWNCNVTASTDSIHTCNDICAANDHKDATPDFYGG